MLYTRDRQPGPANPTNATADRTATAKTNRPKQE